MRLLTAIVLVASCSPPAPPPPGPPDLTTARDLIRRLQDPNTEMGGHGRFHKADNALQNELWALLERLPPGPGVDEILIEAVEKVWTRYDANYLQGAIFHWPYLDSARAIALCDRLVTRHPKSPHRAHALWLKAFALRAPAMEPWPQMEMELGTYGRQAKWRPDPEAARAVYKALAQEFPGTRLGIAAEGLADASDLGLTLPKGPKERDPRSP